MRIFTLNNGEHSKHTAAPNRANMIQLRVAARQALDAPRFAERKRWASLGERLLKVCQHNGHRIVTEAPELVAFEEKYWRRSEHPVSGLWVPYDFTETQARAEEASSASVSAVGSSYLRAVAPSRCVVRMTGPLEEDCRHVVPRSPHLPHAQRTHIQRTPSKLCSSQPAISS